MRDSIVRDGNHFIRLKGLGWVLIDGPWFEQLCSLRHREIAIPVFKPMGLCHFYTDEAPADSFETEVMLWEAVRWNPGYVLFQDAKRIYTFDNKDLFHRWWGMLQRRTKVGWRVKPDGKLPVLFNAVEWHDEMVFL